MELINERLIAVNASIKSREEVIQKFADLLNENQRILSQEEFLNDVYHREEELSTSMGLGVAIPHTQSDAVKEPSLVFLKLSQAISWNGDDNVKIIFGIAVPRQQQCEDHLKILSQLARKLMNDEFRNQLMEVEDAKAGYQMLSFLNEALQ